MCCPERELRALMNDEEFWAHVFSDPGPTEEEYIDAMMAQFQRETWVIHCARCGGIVEVDEETRVDRERDAFCDDCADEMAPEIEETL